MVIEHNNKKYRFTKEPILIGDSWVYICPINGLDYGDDNEPIFKNISLPLSWFEKLHDKDNYYKAVEI